MYLRLFVVFKMCLSSVCECLGICWDVLGICRECFGNSWVCLGSCLDMFGTFWYQFRNMLRTVGNIGMYVYIYSMWNLENCGNKQKHVKHLEQTQKN